MADKHSSNQQKKLKNSVKSAEAEKSNLNQNHNTKKVSLGPNTNR